MIEKSFIEVPPQAFIANGTSGGLVTIANTSIFKVKQKVRIFSDTHSPIVDIEVKQVLSTTTLLVGPKGGAVVDNYINLTTILVSDNAKISADFQNRVPISHYDVIRAAYDEEPTVAIRTSAVDKFGNRYDTLNPVPVSFAGSITTTVRRLTDKSNDGTPDTLPDAIQVGNGINRLQIDSSGSVPTKETPDDTPEFSPINSDSIVYESSRLVKQSPGTIYSITGYNSLSSDQFIQIHNSTVIPADGSIPTVIFIAKALSNFSYSSDKFGRFFSTGVVVCNSSTGPIKTIGLSNCWFNCQFR